MGSETTSAAPNAQSPIRGDTKRATNPNMRRLGVVFIPFYSDFIVLVAGLSPSDSGVRTIEETNYSMDMQILFDRGG